MTDPLLPELLDLALEAARRAGALLRDGRPDDLAVAKTKTSPIDVVTEMDIAAEKLITGFLADHRPHDGFLGEEGASSPGTSGVRWVIDPLDGTVNYLYGLPTWAVSIAAERDGETVVGVVAAPMRGETYRAVLGSGLWRCWCVHGGDGLPFQSSAGTGRFLVMLRQRFALLRGCPQGVGGGVMIAPWNLWTMWTP